MARHGNRPDRRFVKHDLLTESQRDTLADRLVYVGSAHHKRSPGDYGFIPPANPRPSKSLCDGHRVILRAEAQTLFRQGVLKGMFSTFDKDSQPKYVWSVDSDGEVYEAKIGQGGYHGYRLADEDDMRAVVLKEWRKRCQAD